MHNANKIRRRKKEMEEIFEIMMENYPKLMTDAKPHIQETQRTQIRIHKNKNLHPAILSINFRKPNKKRKY